MINYNNNNNNFRLMFNLTDRSMMITSIVRTEDHNLCNCRAALHPTSNSRKRRRLAKEGPVNLGGDRGSDLGSSAPRSRVLSTILWPQVMTLPCNLPVEPILQPE